MLSSLYFSLMRFKLHENGHPFSFVPQEIQDSNLIHIALGKVPLGSFSEREESINGAVTTLGKPVDPLLSARAFLGMKRMIVETYPGLLPTLPLIDRDMSMGERHTIVNFARTALGSLVGGPE